MISFQGNGNSNLNFSTSICSGARFLVVSSLTLALKVRRGGENGDTLVHGPFADPEVVIDPFLQARCLCELFWLNTGTVPSPEGERVYVSATLCVFFGWWCGEEFVDGLSSTAGEAGEEFSAWGRSGPT
jgi:hypothetical protein